jgi:hypothetical protein
MATITAPPAGETAAETLHSAVPTDADVAAMGDHICLLSAQIELLSHERFTYIREFDRLGGWSKEGARTCPHWLTWRTGQDLQTAREHVRVARALGHHRRIDEAFRKGELSYSKVRILTRVATPQNEATLVEQGKQTTEPQLRRVCKSYQEKVQGTADEALCHPDERRSFETHTLASGLVRLSAQVRPEEAAVLMKGLELAIARLREGGSSAGEPPGETSRHQVDALILVFEQFLASKPETTLPSPYEVTLHVVRANDTSELVGVLPDGRVIADETVRRTLCSAPIVTVTYDDAGNAHASRKDGRVTKGQRRSLKARDLGCTFPGCTYMAYFDAHHIHHRIDGGKTTLSNLTLLCRGHHTLVHEGGFKVQKTPSGLAFFDPSGRRLENAPRLPDLGPNAAGELARARRERGIVPQPRKTKWERSPLDLIGAVNALREAGAEL